MNSYARMMTTAPNEYEPLIRELLSYDAQCKVSSPFVRDDNGKFRPECLPQSPLHWSRQVEWPWAILESDPQLHHSCLDVGGGWGVFKYALANRVRSVENIEPSAEFIAKAQSSIDVINTKKNIHQYLGTIECTPYHRDSFDRIYCISVLEHIKYNRLQCIREMQRLLKPDGVLMLSMDVVINDGQISKGDMYVGWDEAYEILNELRITGLKPHDVYSMAYVPNIDVWIAVILCRWIKPN